jgi:hypothetical protein
MKPDRTTVKRRIFVFSSTFIVLLGFLGLTLAYFVHKAGWKSLGVWQVQRYFILYAVGALVVAITNAFSSTKERPEE